jgi:hypothetical protein
MFMRALGGASHKNAHVWGPLPLEAAPFTFLR